MVPEDLPKSLGVHKVVVHRVRSIILPLEFCLCQSGKHIIYIYGLVKSEVLTQVGSHTSKNQLLLFQAEKRGQAYVCDKTSKELASKAWSGDV